MFRNKLQPLILAILFLPLVGCGSLGSRATPAPVDDPNQVETPTSEAGNPSQVDNPEQRVIVAPVPATRIAPQRSSPQSGSALKKLQLAALSQQRTGKYTRAAATLERALRISPRDAALWSQLAQVRLQQKKWRLAVNMAAKSNALAGARESLQRKNWLLMSKAYRALGQNNKANAALQKAR